MRPLVIGLLCVTFGVGATGCRAVGGALGNRDAELRTGQWWAGPLPETTPVGSSARTAWVSVKNATAVPLVALAAQVEQAIVAQGYRLVEDPERAHVQVIYTVRYAGESQGDDGRAVVATLGAVGGGATGASLAHLSGASSLATLGGGLGGAVLGAAVGTLIHHYGQVIEYAYVVDVRLAQRQKAQVTRSIQARHTDRQDTGTLGHPGGMLVGGGRVARHDTQQQVQETSAMLWHETRLVAWARQMRLQPQEAQPVLEATLVRSLAAVLP